MIFSRQNGSVIFEQSGEYNLVKGVTNSYFYDTYGSGNLREFWTVGKYTVDLHIKNKKLISAHSAYINETKYCF